MLKYCCGYGEGKDKIRGFLKHNIVCKDLSGLASGYLILLA